MNIKLWHQTNIFSDFHHSSMKRSQNKHLKSHATQQQGITAKPGNASLVSCLILHQPTQCFTEVAIKVLSREATGGLKWGHYTQLKFNTKKHQIAIMQWKHNRHTLTPFPK